MTTAGPRRKVFHEEFDTMITELAYDMTLELRAAPGLKIAGVYGIFTRGPARGTVKLVTSGSHETAQS